MKSVNRQAARPASNLLNNSNQETPLHKISDADLENFERPQSEMTANLTFAVQGQRGR